MLPAAAPATRVTPEEYLAFDRASDVPNEYVNGEIRAMTGASREHGLLVTNVTGLLHGLLRGRPCEIFSHGIRVRIPLKGNYVYPDVVVACGGTQLEDDEHDTLLNPVVVFEVLSPSTAAYDRGEKWDMYRRIPSLRDYLLVSQTEPLVHRYRRSGEEQQIWEFDPTEGLDASIEMESIGCVLQMADIYERVFPAEPEEASSTQEAR
ncbi:MAG TPA: Uma2 family endonuclease [Longimicrobium sp.]|jgi:Uma2 family endonuclease